MAGASSDRLSRRLALVTRRRGPLVRLWVLMALERRLMIRVGVLQVFQAVTFVPFTAAVEWLIRYMGRADVTPEAKLWFLAAYVLGNILLWIPHAWFTVLAFSDTQALVRSGTARLRRLVVDQLQRMSLNFFTARGAGALSNQVTVDMGRIEGLLNQVASQLLVNLSLAGATIAYLLVKNPLLCLAGLLVVPVQYGMISLLRHRLEELNRRVQVSGEGFSATMVEFIAGMRLTKSFGNEDEVAVRINRTIEDLRMHGLAASVAMRWLALGLQFSWQFTQQVVLWVVGMVLALRPGSEGGVAVAPGELGELVAFSGLFVFMNAGLSAFTATFDAWLQAKPGAEGLFQLIDSRELEEARHSGQSVPLHGEIRFDRVTFRYPGAVETAALQEVDLVIPQGQRIGLVGETGAGKSTFLDLVLGFYHSSSGRITWDGRALQDVGLKNLRRQCAIMGQDAFLWNTTVAENIRFGRPDADDEAVRAAAMQAQAHEFIERLEHGYRTVCGERGSRLSGGQRQRIALARVFLRDPRIIVLDEPTSALDLETEAKLQQDLEVLCRGRTTFIVAHRLSTLRGVDRILVFSQGRIVEDGTPKELLARPNGQFARLSSFQKN